MMTDAQRVERYLVADGFKRGASQPVAGAVKMVGRRNGRACTFWIQSHADTVRVCRVGATLQGWFCGTGDGCCSRAGSAGTTARAAAPRQR